ncbi:MAG: type II toxin-antitoxin system HicA family toxin [Bdellovibrionales bacterium]
MAKGFYKNLTKLLKANGCIFVRQGKGDHEIWYSPISDKNFPVDKIVKSKFLANAVLKQAGIDHKF